MSLPRTEVEPDQSADPSPKPRPAVWSDFDSFEGPVPVDPNWGSSSTQEELATVDPRLRESPPTGHDPWPTRDPDPLPRPAEPKPEAIPPLTRPPSPGAPRPGPKTPSAYSEKVEPAKPARPIRRGPPARDELRTRPIGDGFGLGQGISNRLLMIQYFDGVGHWRELEPLRPELHLLGRPSFRRGTSATEFLAAEHLRFVSAGDRLFVEEGETLNGVYLKVSTARPVELTPGTRFQVGQHVIEFQLPDRSNLDQPMVSPDGEVLRWRRMEPMAYLDFVGPGHGPPLRFPLTKLDGTVIGREGDIALTGDTWASRSHAKVVRQGERFFLEDLGSTNGTFVKITSRTLIKPGDLQSSVSGDILLIGAVLIRVVEI